MGEKMGSNFASAKKEEKIQFKFKMDF